MPIKNQDTIPGASLASTTKVLAGLAPNFQFNAIYLNIYMFLFFICFIGFK